MDSGTLWCAGQSPVCQLPANKKAILLGGNQEIRAPVVKVGQKLCIGKTCLTGTDSLQPRPSAPSSSTQASSTSTTCVHRDELKKYRPLGFPYDLTLAGQGGSGDPRGNSGASRALVKDHGATLVLNYANDFRGGVRVDSAMTVKGVLRADSLHLMNDTRHSNDPPSHYRRRVASAGQLGGKFSDFKHCSAVGIGAGGGAFCVVDTIVPWPDTSGGRVKQVAHTDTALFYRVGSANDSAWEAWKSVSDSGKSTAVAVASSSSKPGIGWWNQAAVAKGVEAATRTTATAVASAKPSFSWWNQAAVAKGVEAATRTTATAVASAKPSFSWLGVAKGVEAAKPSFSWSGVAKGVEAATRATATAAVASTKPSFSWWNPVGRGRPWWMR